MENVRYGGFWIRFGAYFIDSLLLIGIYFLLFVLSFVMWGTSFEALNREFVMEHLRNVGMFTNISAALVGWLYFALQYASKAQATIGMRIMGLKVVDYDYGRISFLRATGRHFGHYVSSFILYIGFVMIAFTEKKQALHDFMAGTYVIRN